MTFDVIVQDWHENSIGEQGNGPPRCVATYPTREEAEATVRMLQVVREETDRGGAYGTWAYVRQTAGSKETV